MRDGDTVFRDILTAPFSGTGDEHRRLRAVIGHATSFWTWRSLCIDQGLSDIEAVDAMTGMALAVIPCRRPIRRSEGRGRLPAPRGPEEPQPALPGAWRSAARQAYRH